MNELLLSEAAPTELDVAGRKGLRDAKGAPAATVLAGDAKIGAERRMQQVVSAQAAESTRAARAGPLERMLEHATTAGARVTKKR